MIDEKELEYNPSEFRFVLYAYIAFLALLLLLSFIVVPSSAISQVLPGILIFAFPAVWIGIQRNITRKKNAALKVLVSQMPPDERQAAFLQAYYTDFIRNLLGLSTTYMAFNYPSVKSGWAKWTEQMNYRVLVLQKDRIRLYEFEGNNAGMKTREFKKGQMTEITRNKSDIMIELVFKFKASDKAGEYKVYVNASNFADFQKFESAVKGFYADLIVEKKGIFS
jgi:hypothetical protein